jgi:hypothetical protein
MKTINIRERRSGKVNWEGWRRMPWCVWDGLFMAIFEIQ